MQKRKSRGERKSFQDDEVGGGERDSSWLVSPATGGREEAREARRVPRWGIEEAEWGGRRLVLA
jgi:hypothetical protein